MSGYSLWVTGQIIDGPYCSTYSQGLLIALYRNQPMTIKFSEGIVPLNDLKTNPGRVVKHLIRARRPVPVTSRGRGIAVMQSLVDVEMAEEERAFMRAVVEGLSDFEAGREFSLHEVKARLDLE